MTRLPLTFACSDKTLSATLDTASGTSGLLIVSGGSEIRSGAFSGQARLAARIAAAGFPVFRFDRRGIGDSAGQDRGFRKSEKDIAAAIAAFRAMAPKVDRVVAFGNCDAASALMLFSGAGCDALVLSNPWVIEGNDHAVQPPAAVRARYAEKLRNPRELLRLLKGQINIGKLLRGLLMALKPSPAPTSLAQEMKSGLEAFHGPVQLLLASRDRTAQIFASVWDANDPRIMRCQDAGHSYVEPDARDWLYERLLAALRG